MNKITIIELFVVAILAFMIYLLYDFLVPSITVINKTNIELSIQSPEYRVEAIDENGMVDNATSSEIDTFNRSVASLKTDRKTKVRLGLNKLFDEVDYYFGVAWRHFNKELGFYDVTGGIQYSTLKGVNDVCHVTITITDEGFDVEESSWRYCFRGLSKDTGILME